MRGKTAVIAVAFAVASTSMGCGEEMDPFGDGELSLDWDVAPLGCESSGVSEVVLRLENERRSYTERFDCESRTATLRAVVAGSYDLRLRGSDAEGRETFGVEKTGVTIRPDDQLELGTVELVALPGVAEVEWFFENQRVCGTNEVSSVEITAYDSAYYEVHRSTSRCDSGSVEVEGLHAGNYLFRVRGKSDRFVYEGISEGMLKRGDEVFIEVGMVRIE